MESLSLTGEATGDDYQTTTRSAEFQSPPLEASVLPWFPEPAQDDSRLIEQVTDDMSRQTLEDKFTNPPMRELAMKVWDLLGFSDNIAGVNSLDSLELALYRLATRVPMVNRLVWRVARGEAPWSEFEDLERRYKESDEYLAARSRFFSAVTLGRKMKQPLHPEPLAKADLAPPPPSADLYEPPVEDWSFGQEEIDIEIPQDIHLNDKTWSPRSGRGDDPHGVSLPEDSGYGSIAENIYLSRYEAKEGAGKAAEGTDGDAKTTYSIATNEDPVQTRDFVYELANDIYGNLKHMMGPDDWLLVSRSLPELLKAFAIKIGSDGTSQASRDVMYFIHKEHQNIVNQFKNLLLGQVDDAQGASYVDADTNSVDTMSLRDKMDMWQQNFSVEESATESCELFQNVADDESNVTVSLMYNKMVVNSKHYDWLIQSLMTELSLERHETHISGKCTSF
ncbi:hypothetical protein ACHAPT_011206 [Fusarium lateritium]